ncbi:MAG: ABC transporter permease [Acidobacteriota bacterium]|nr:ABC transporter permease [Acidobacteriota bacterium]
MRGWLRSAFARVARWRRFESDMADELAFHLQSRIDDLVASGLSPDDAARQARLEFGGVDLYKERCRDARRSRFAIVGLGGDLRYALRTFRKSPGFVAAAVLTLALGIGANTAIFSVVYGLLVRPLPYRQADRLVLVDVRERAVGTGAATPVYFSPDTMRAWSAGLRSFDGFASYASTVSALSTSTGTEVFDTATVSGNFFTTLDGSLVLGRPFTTADSRAATAVISNTLWHRLFDNSPAVLGRTMLLNAEPYTIIGVAASTFQFPTADTDIWVPVEHAPPSRGGIYLAAIGRLKPGIPISQAQADVRATAAAMAHDFPRVRAASGARLIRLRDDMVRTMRPALLVLWAAVGLVLLVACANVVNLLVARDAAHARETAVRLSLGASRGRLVRQALVGTGLLAAGGCALGLIVADAGLSALRALNPLGLPLLDQVRLDGPVRLFAVGLAAVVTLATGPASALRRPHTGDLLRGQAPGATRTLPGRRVRAALCIAQIAISLVLLVGATLLGRSLAQLLGPGIGVQTGHVMTASINMPFGQPADDADVMAAMNRVVERVRALPGVEAAGLGTSLPPETSRLRITMNWPDPVTGRKTEYAASGVPSTPDFFRALGIRLVEGRFFTAADGANHPQVMIMSRQTAERFFGAGDPLGKTMTLPTVRDGRKGPGMTMTLVGVVDNVKYAGLAAAPDDTIYRPFAQQPWRSVFLVVRTTPEPDGFASTLRKAIGAADPTLVVGTVSPLTTIVDHAAAQPRFRTFLLASLATLGVLLAAVGLGGVIGYSVSQRTTEIGVRMALGANQTDVLRMMLREGLVLAWSGLAVGVLAAFGLARTLRSLLYGVAPTDPASFIGAALLLFVVALVACYLPARRAARVDPAVALRAE